MITSIPFGTRTIGRGQSCLVIAEIGINHEGDVDACLRMVEAAAHSGADAVKLQSNNPALNYAPGTPSYALFSKSMLGAADTRRVFEAARRLGMEAFTSPGDVETVQWHEALTPPAVKISSGSLSNIPLIEAAARTGRSLLMSTGMAETGDIDLAVGAARGAGCRNILLFQCTSLYPAPFETINLARIHWLEARYGVPVGFSDHSLGVEAAPLAVAAGACAIEKHFTLDVRRPGYDHGISLGPAEFADMVARIRTAEQLFGVAEPAVTEAERDIRHRMRRRVALLRDVAAGTQLTSRDLAIMRVVDPTDGLEPRLLTWAIGRRVNRNLSAFTAVRAEHLSD